MRSDDNPANIESSTDALFPESGHPALPSFIRPVLSPDVSGGVAYWDSWVVESTGDPGIDVRLGAAYADSAIRFARAINQPNIVAAVLLGVTDKVRRGDDATRYINMGFLERIARVAFVGSCN